MNYFILIENAKGESRLVPITDIKEIAVIAGDDLVVMDEQGNPVDVSLRPDGKDLVVDFKNGENVVLKGFYEIEEGADPITISLNPKEPVDAGYEFNSQTGNLPNAKSFTLMRYSNTEYVSFVEQIDELGLARFGGTFAAAATGMGGGGGGGNALPKNDDPDAVDDSGETDQNTPLIITVLANDTDPNADDALVVKGVDQPLRGSVSINAENQLIFDPGSDFTYLGAGESEVVSFNYSIFDGNGGTDTATVTITVHGVDDASVTAPDSGVTNEETPITIDVLANDHDPDTNENPLWIDSVTQPLLGFVTNNINDVTFDPGTDFNYLAAGETATVTFSYTTNTGITETVTVTINGVNDAPDANDDDRTTDQNTPIIIGALTNDTDPDGTDSLSIIGVTQPGKGTVTYNAGDLTFDPGNEFDSLGAGETETVTFSYTISDGNGGTDTATITVTINGVDDATVTAPDTAATNEDAPVTINVLANDADPDSSDIPLTITSVTQPVLGSVVNNGTDVTFNPGSDFQYLAAGETATVIFTYTTDTGATENVTVTINGVNDGPDAIDDARTTDQNTTLTINAIGNDTDADGSDVLLITGVDQPGKGTTSINANNQIVFDPGNDFVALGAGESATVTFNYSISDGNGGTDTATITVTINGVDDPTVTAPDAATTNEETPVVIDVLANDSDADTSDIPLTITSVTQPALGSVVNNGTNVTFNPGSDFQNLAIGETATVTFTYTTDTGATEDVTVTITGVNDAPTAIDDTETTDQNSVVNIDLVGPADSIGPDTDPDGGSLVISQINGIAAGGTITLPSGALVTVNANGTVDYNPNGVFDSLDAGESAIDTFTYTISDGNGGTDTATATVTINGVEDATLTAPDAATTNEDAPVTINVLANDSDVDSSDNPLTIVSVTQPALGTVVNNGNDVTFNPGTDFQNLAAGETATVTFTYTTDTGATENVVVTINGLNDAPDAIDDARTTDQDTPLVINALGNDTDPDSSDVLFITGVTQPAKGTVTYNAGDLTFDPGNDFDDLATGETATVTFNYFISDGNGGTDTATITVTVNGADDATVTAPDAAVTNEDTPVVIDVLANDSDADTSDNPLTISAVTQPALGSVTNNGNNVTFDPGSDFQNLATGETATVTFTYTTDTGATENVTVTITGLNDGPDAIDDDRTTDQDTPLVINAISNDTDPDGSDVLLITGVDQPAKGSASISANNQIVFDPGNDFDDLGAGESATVTFNYSISDGNGGTDTATITVTINGVDDATITAPDAAITNEDTSVVIDVLANDSDADTSDNPLAIVSVTQPLLGSVVNNGNNVSFNPGSDFQNLAAGESATVTFTYTTDTGVIENVTVTINGLNDGPDAIDDARTTDQDTPLVIDAISNDTDPDGSDVLLIIGVDQPGKGSASINASNQIVFNPGNDFDYLGAGESETVTFNYSISDGNGGTDTATITVTINGVDDATITAPDAATTNEDSPVTIDVLANDSDADTNDNPLTITSVTQPTLGTVTNNGTNVTFNPGSDFQNLAVGETATVTFTYTTDTGATENVVVTINGVNDGPDAVNDGRTTDQNTVVNIDLLTNDTDIDGDTLSVVVINGTAVAPNSTVTLPSGAIVTLFANGTVGYDPNGQFDSLDAGESAADSFTYVISDGNGGSDVATVNLTINGTEDATVTAPDAATTDEETPVIIDVLANDVDPDTADNPLTISGVTQPPKGSVTNNGNNVTFDPGADFQNLGAGESETVTFTYTTATGVTETVTVTVNGVDDPTVTQPDSAITTEDSPVTIDVLVNDSDPDASDNPLTIGSFTQPAKGSITSNGTSIVFDPGSDFQDLATGESETVTFTYTTDTGVTETVTITVNGADDLPLALDDSGSTNQNTVVNLDVLGNDSDPDGDVLSVASINGNSGGGTILLPSGALLTLLPNGTVNYNPNGVYTHLDAGESATDTFTYVVSDGNGGTDTAEVTVTINGVEDALDAANDVATTFQNTPIFINTLVNDSDPDTNDNPLTVVGVSAPALGLATFTPTGVAFNPNGDFDYLNAGETATVTFNYTVQNASGDTDVASVTVTVLGSNDPTITNPDSASTGENTPVVINVLANDSDADANQNPLTISSVTQPSLGTVVNNGTNVTFNPGAAFNYLAAGETATVTFTYTTNTGSTENVTVTVNGVNDAPDAINDSRTTSQGTPLLINALGNDTDPDTSDVLVITGVTQPALGSVTFTSGNLTFNPGTAFNYLDAGQSTTVTFNYTISDGNGGSDTATITVTVTGAEDPTNTTPDTGVTNEDTPVLINVLANDSDVDLSDNPLTITSVTQPALGVVTHNGTSLTFNPDGDFESLAVGATATVTFTYTTNTGATENVTVTINGVNDAPVANDDIVVSTTDILPVTINVVANDTDVDGTVNPATVDLDVNTAGIQTTLTIAGEGTWTTNGSGMVTFTPTSGINNQPTPLTYAVSDNNGATSTATIDLKYSAADVWFGNDESGSVNTADFNQSRNLISGAANQMSFATGSIAFNAALFTWADTSSQQMELSLSTNKTSFVNGSANYTRNYSGGTDIGQGIVFGTQQILASVAARQLANHPRAGVPQVMVILTDAMSSQILNDTSLLADAQAAKNAGIILVFVAIQEAQQDPLAVARLEQAASVDQNGDPFVITAANYSDIGPATIADLLNEIREAAAAGLLPPVVIDLDGDGAEFLDIDNGILFDVDGDGEMEQVAWAGNDDAVLVYDENGNNNVDGVHEISFARYGSNPNATDLEGLRFFDTNNDLILDANDAEFESFKLWQDRNGNGIVDEGEMMTLSEAGIKSIELTSDGSTYYSAGGDVKVNGTAVVHYEDGTSGTAADAEFGYRELIEADDSIEIMTSDGDVLDLSSNPNSPEPGSDPVGPDLLEPSGGGVFDSGEGEFGGAPVTTNLDDDLAAAGVSAS